MSEAAVRDLLKSLLPTLSFVHSKHIVHRDIKPDNIILKQRDQQPILIDFGAVKETMGTLLNAQGKSTQSIVIGTPGFMPSEQAAGRPIYASDLYSLGLTAIYLLTGKMPPELPTDSMSGEIQWRQYALNITPSFASLLDRAILPHGRDRFQTAQQMLDALITGSTPVPNVSSVATPSPTITSVPPQGYTTPHNGHAASNGFQTPTVVSQPMAAQSMPVSQMPSKGGMSEWMKAMLTGSLIGSFVLGGLWIAPAVTPVPTPTPMPTPAATPVPTPAPVLPSAPNLLTLNSPISVPTQPSISQQDAISLVDNWLQAKRIMFAPPYSYAAAKRVATGLLLTDLTKAGGSIDWLDSNNAQYKFGVQKIESVDRFVANGQQATIEAWVTEDRTLYKNGRVDPDQTDFKTRLINYSLQQVDGTWKISDYKLIRSR